MEGLFSPTIIIFVIAIFLLIKTINIVPQQEAWIIERLGKFDRTVHAGLNILIPFIESVAYKHSFKETALNIKAQTAISQDNVSLTIDGVLYTKIIDPKAASYGVHDPYYAITELAQTVMRSEIGKIPLDQTFEERERLNIAIVNSINTASSNWGIQCMRYEIKDIHPPATVLKAMELQVAAERRKRAEILESEGNRQSKINLAEALKAEIVLNSEAAKTDKINRAEGDGEAIKLVAKATAQGIEQVADSILKKGGENAVSLKVAEQYIDALSNLAKKGNTLIIPSSINDPSSVIAQAMSIYKSLSNNTIKKDKKDNESS